MRAPRKRISDDEMSNVKKVLLSVSIENILLRIGGPKLFEEVHQKMMETYLCETQDCYNNPQYIIGTLRGSFRHAYDDTMTMMKKEFEDFACQDVLFECLAGAKAQRQDHA